MICMNALAIIVTIRWNNFKLDTNSEIIYLQIYLFVMFYVFVATIVNGPLWNPIDALKSEHKCIHSRHKQKK